MNDPTTPILAACFLVAAAAYAGSVLVRQAIRSGGSAPPPVPGGRVATWFFKPLDLAFGAAVFMVFFGFFILNAATADATADDLTAPVLVFNIFFQFILAGFIIGLGVIRAPLSTWLGLRWSGWPWLFLVAPACVMGMWLVLLGINALGYHQWMESLDTETVQNTVQLLQQSTDPLVLVLMAVTAVLVAPLCEEVVFRGYLYPVMKRFGGIWPAAICSSLVFAAAHGNLAATLPLFILSLVLVLLFEKTGSLWAPVALHFCFNGASVGIQLLARIYELPPELIGP